ncbi:MAG: PhoH family protein [Sphaerochaetaceae bacterium]|nr:PhoH family protein [Sphaerochaetaceae bacterium]
MTCVCGPNDINLSYIEDLLNCSVFPKGNRIVCQCNEEKVSLVFSSLMERLVTLTAITKDITQPEILMEFKTCSSLLSEEKEDGESKKRAFITIYNKSVYPKSSKQEDYIKSMEENQITFAVGPAGTGKTFLAVSYALGELLKGRKQKIILTRPVVEAGESLGFLPGDLSQKLNPYLKPLYDSMEALVSPATIKRLEDTNAIEIAPLAYMRGRSIHNAVIILDEAQNTTQAQMKMFLTRIGENSCAIITGDVTQIDLPKPNVSGLVHAINILQDIEGLAFIRFSATDTVRSRIVQRIIDAYEKKQEQ